MDQVLSHYAALEEKGFRFRKEDPEGQLLYVVEDDKDHDIVQAHVHVVLKDSKPGRTISTSEIPFEGTEARPRNTKGSRSNSQGSTKKTGRAIRRQSKDSSTKS